MSYQQRILTEEEICEAKLLRGQGWTKRKLAEKYGVGDTTIWENVYFEGKRIRKPRPKRVIYSFRKIPSVVILVKSKQREGFNSREVSDMFNIPLLDVNFMFGHYY